MSDRTRKFFNMILALIIAIAGWIYVIYNFYPNTNVTYRNVPITYTGEEELANKGLGVTEATVDSITVTLNQERVKTAEISADDITVIADVSDCIEGDNGIGLQISGPDGTTVSDSSTRTMTVTIDKVKTETVDVYVEFSDASDLGAEPIVDNLSDETATIVSASDELDSVDKVVAYISISDMTEQSRSFTRDLVAVDEDGNELQHIIIYPESVSFDAISGYTKAVNLNVNVKGASDDDYTREYEAPSSILIKGPEDVINAIDSIDTTTINLSNVDEDTTIALKYDLPDGVYIANESLNQVITVTVTENESDDDE